MSNLRIITNIVGRLDTNCYFIYHEQTKETIIVDPADNANFIQDKCKQMKLRPVAILLTHGHFDHIYAAEDIKAAFDIPIYAGILEQGLLANSYQNISKIVNMDIQIVADRWLRDGEIVSLAGFLIKVIATAGHTMGSICYYIEKENVLISGDTLFKNGVGRTDLPTSNQLDLMNSIQKKLFTLPNNTNVYSGHGESTTIAREKQRFT